MTDESNGHTRPDFDEHLREVVRRRQSQQAADDGLGEDRLNLSGRSGERDVFSPKGVRSARDHGGNDQLTWVALGLGAAALVITLILGALLYRQGGQISRLDQVIAVLEEQMEVNNPQQIGSGLQADIAQLSARLNAMASRLARLEQDRTAGGPADAELKEQIDRLNETVSQLQARLARLETKRASAAKAKTTVAKSAAKPGAKGWYIVLASLADSPAAKKLQQRYRRQGVEADIQQVEVRGARRYRLRVGPFDTAKQAQRQAEQIKRKLKLTSVWLSR